jgi:lysophospholipase L1-like esterase
MAELFKGWLEGPPSSSGTVTGYRPSDERRGRRGLDQEMLAKDLPPLREGDRAPRIYIDPSAYEGIEVRIEDPTGHGLTPFYEALLATAEHREGAVTRVGHWGDSSIATDLITHTLRRRLQHRFGDAGHGFHLIASGYMPYRHRDVTHDASEDWLLRELVRDHDEGGAYGYGGVQFRGRPGSWAKIGTAGEDAPVGRSASRFDLYVQRHPRGGDVMIRIDDGPFRPYDTRAEEPTDDVISIALPDGPHQVMLRVGAASAPRLYGAVLERNGPGVVYDSLGMVGARAARILHYDAERIAAQVERRGLHLVVLGFGGNEASDRIQPSVYRADYERVIERMRGGRADLGCLVFAPLDQGMRDTRGRIVSMPTMDAIVRSQREAAFAKGCAFFDTRMAMGGRNSMRDWYQARPRLALSDLRHATPAGYEILGNLFYKALLEGFAGFLASRETASAGM